MRRYIRMSSVAEVYQDVVQGHRLPCLSLWPIRHRGRSAIEQSKVRVLSPSIVSQMG